MFTTHFYDDKIDDVAVSYLVLKIISHLALAFMKNRTKKFSFLFLSTRSLIKNKLADISTVYISSL